MYTFWVFISAFAGAGLAQWLLRILYGREEIKAVIAFSEGIHAKASATAKERADDGEDK